MTTIDPATQLDRFNEGVTLLGGSRSAAAQMGVTERTIQRLCSGQRSLHEGYLRDMAAALRTHYERCRALERHLTPLFSSNVLPGQHERWPRGDAYHQSRKD